MITLKVDNFNEEMFESIEDIISHLKSLAGKEISGFIEFKKFNSGSISGNSSLVFSSSMPEAIISALGGNGGLCVTGSI